MPRLQVLNARTPCCGNLVHLRPGSEGKTYLITCQHNPRGRLMTVHRNDDGALECVWEDGDDGDHHGEDPRERVAG